MGIKEIRRISFSGYNQQYDKYRKPAEYNQKKEKNTKNFAAILEAASKNQKF